MKMSKFFKQLGAGFVILCMLLTFLPAISYSATTDEGYEEGYSEGWLDGIEEAEYDLMRGRSKNYSRAMPSNDEIIKAFNLDKETTKYRNAFIEGYKDGFRNGYNKTYSDDGYSDGNSEDKYAENIGYAMGEVFGYKDYYEGKSNRWSRNFPSNSDIIETYDLRKETSDYRTNFLDVFKANFQKGYEEAYRKAKFEPFKGSLEQGKKDGEHFGGLLGEMQGKKDFYYGRISNWNRNLPSRAKIINDFLLNRDSDEYEDAFIEAFVKAYEEKYNEAYRGTNSSINDLFYENGYNYGKSIGLEKGQGLATMDLLLGQYNSVQRHMATEYEIINEFELHLQSEKYREGFISGYNEGLNEGYVKAFQDLSFANLQTRLITKIIPLSGGGVNTKDNRFSIKVSAGTYYNDVGVSIDGLMESSIISLPPKDRFIQASEVYSVKIANSSYIFDNDKTIELSFEYYGPQNGGIYKYTNNSWVYLPSKITENRITTYIRPSSINTSNGIYAVFIDKNFVNIKDVRGHWAKDEINAYIRNGITWKYGDNTYRPDLPITRVQLLELLNKVYKWNLTGLDDKLKEMETLKDFDTFGGYKLLIAYALKNGYFDLYSDNTFKIDSKVTYNQINQIMRKVTKDNNFSWANVASSIVKDKDTRSKSVSSMNSNITRAESIYMLYLLNEWKN